MANLRSPIRPADALENAPVAICELRRFAISLGARDLKHVELANQVTEDDRAVAGHSITVLPRQLPRCNQRAEGPHRGKALGSCRCILLGRVQAD